MESLTKNQKLISGGDYYLELKIMDLWTQLIFLKMCIIMPRPGNTGLMSNGDSLISWEERSFLALVGNPSRDGVSIKTLV